jgi:hypothetical protein
VRQHAATNKIESKMDFKKKKLNHNLPFTPQILFLKKSKKDVVYSPPEDLLHMCISMCYLIRM